MRLPVRLMRQTLTVTATVPGEEDPFTGATSGASVITVLSQPCSLQQVRRAPDGGLPPVSGVATETPAFRCYTPHFTLSATEGVMEFSVDGLVYPLARRIDVAGQGNLTELHFGQPQEGA